MIEKAELKSCISRKIQQFVKLSNVLINIYTTSSKFSNKLSRGFKGRNYQTGNSFLAAKGEMKYLNTNSYDPIVSVTVTQLTKDSIYITTALKFKHQYLYIDHGKRLKVERSIGYHLNRLLVLIRT